MADRYSRSLMMVIFHFGIGIAAVLAGMTQTVWQLGAAIGLIGVFAAIYHPVGIAMLIKSNRAIGFRLGINGVFGNMGVAAAPLVIGVLLTFCDWRLCFAASGLFCIAYGMVFMLRLVEDSAPAAKKAAKGVTGFAPGWQMALGATHNITEPLAIWRLLSATCARWSISPSISFAAQVMQPPYLQP